MSSAERAVGPVGAEVAATHGEAVRTVFGNAVALVLAYALPRVLTIGAVVLAARVLGAAAFGAYGAAGAVAVIASILSTAGMQPLLVREIARAPRSAAQHLRAAHWVKTALNTFMLAALALFCAGALGMRGDVLWAALLLGTGYAISSYSENLAAWFQAVERMHVWTVANAIYGVVAGVAGAVLIWTTRSLPWFCAAMVLGHLCALAWLQRAYRRERPRAGLAAATWPGGSVSRLLRAAVPFGAAFLALTVFYKADLVLLSRLRPAADAGTYAAAYKLVDIAQALALAAIIATYPRLVRAAERRGAERWAAARVGELALLCMAPAAAIAFLLRESLIGALFGAGYTGAVVPAAFLLLALVPLALNLVGGYVLAATDRMAHMAALYGSLMVLKLGAVVLVAPRSGAAGVAGVMLAAELLLACGMIAVLRHVAHAAPGRRSLMAVAAVGAACAVAAQLPAVSGGLFQVLALVAFTAVLYRRLDVLPVGERAVLRAALLGRRAAPALLP